MVKLVSIATCCLITLFFYQAVVNCQQYVSKTVYYTSENCTGVEYATFYVASPSVCTYTTPADKCATLHQADNTTIYFKYECAAEVPTVALSNTFNAYLWKNTTGMCVGKPNSVQITPINKCVQNFGSSFYVFIGSTEMTYYSDSQCTKKMYSLSFELNKCLTGYFMQIIGGSLPQPSPTPNPPTPVLQQYERLMFYNGSVQGGSSCLNGVSGQVYRPSVNNSCESVNCQGGSNGIYQRKDCTTSIPTDPATGTFHITTYSDQSLCTLQKSLLKLEVYPIDSCSPYSPQENNSTTVFPQIYIKSDGCKTLRKFNDSSCSQLLAQFDLSANLNICGYGGVKYTCKSNTGGGGGGGGNNGGITGGNSTRANSSSTFHLNSFFSLALILFATMLGMLSSL